MKKSLFSFSTKVMGIFALAFIFSSVFLSTSCNDNTVAPAVTKKKDNGVGIQTYNYNALANANNPYDSIGILHNEGLDYVISHGLRSSNYSTQLVPLAKDFLNSKGYDGTSFQYVNTDSAINAIMNSMTTNQTTPEDQLTSFYNNGYITSTQKT